MGGLWSSPLISLSAQLENSPIVNPGGLSHPVVTRTLISQAVRKSEERLKAIYRRYGDTGVGKNKVTILYVFRLLKRQKKAVVYNVTEKRFYELKALAHWEEFISQSRAVFVHGFSRSAKVELGDVELMPVKKIFAKFG